MKFIATLYAQFALLTSVLAVYDGILRIPLCVPIFIVTDVDRGIGDALASDISKSLREMLPIYSPRNTFSSSKSNDVLFHLEYKTVSQFGTTFLDAYKGLIHGSNKDGEFSIVSTTALQQLLSLFEIQFVKSQFNTLPVVVVISSSLPKHKLGSSGQCFSSYVDDVAFYDFSAWPCDNDEVLFNNPKSFVNGNRLNHIINGGTSGKMNIQDMTITNRNLATWTLLVSVIVTSAIDSLAIGNAVQRPSLFSSHIYVPIVTLKNGGVYSSDEANTSHINESIDAANIEKWLYSMLLPQQHITVVSTTYYVDEHPQLGVAFTSAQHSFIASWSGTGTTNETLSAKVPYVESTVLVHELMGISDRFCNQLLLKSGFDTDIDFGITADKNKILSTEGRKVDLKSQQMKPDKGSKQSKLILEKASASKPLRKAGSSSENTIRQHQNLLASSSSLSHSVTVLPVFILSDLHIHHRRDAIEINRQMSDAPPIQPLFENDDAVVIKDNSAFILHSSDSTVVSYSRKQKSWLQSGISDLQSLTAEGIAKLVTGLSAPHRQIEESSDTIDVTWTAGNHPFRPYSSINQMINREGKNFSQVDTAVAHESKDSNRNEFENAITWAGKRTMAIAKGRVIYRKIHLIHQRMRSLQAIYSKALEVIKNMKKEAIIRDEFHVPEKISPEEQMKEMHVTNMEGEMQVIDGHIRDVDSQLETLQSSFLKGDFNEIGTHLSDLGSSCWELEVKLLEIENGVEENLSQCAVNFDEIEDDIADLAFTKDQFVTSAGKGAFGNQNNKPTIHSLDQQTGRRRRNKAVADENSGRPIYRWLALLGLLALLAAVTFLSDKITNRARKMK